MILNVWECQELGAYQGHSPMMVSSNKMTMAFCWDAHLGMFCHICHCFGPISTIIDQYDSLSISYQPLFTDNLLPDITMICCYHVKAHTAYPRLRLHHVLVLFLYTWSCGCLSQHLSLISLIFPPSLKWWLPWNSHHSGNDGGLWKDHFFQRGCLSSMKLMANIDPLRHR